ncbi:5'/3'-nucleotidase SurE [Nonomuraea sp. NPDC050540]|uniref:5'/3'-nucleotidase SurE n=1 Tax=Nonomuraea sp. NPDC050540 TaxID=3364367 RepID=UPI003793CE51
MRILVTNDDGVDSESVAPLLSGLKSLDAEVVVAVPDGDVSGCGAWLGAPPASSPVRIRNLDDEPSIWAVAGTPGYIVSAACLGAFGAPPDLVVSGVNFGANTGRHILYSGTVGAALVAAQFGIPAVAVSQIRGALWRVYSGVRVAIEAAALLGEERRPQVLNVNVPNLELGDINGVRPAALAPFRVMSINHGDGTIQRDHPATPPPESDEAQLEDRYVTVTRLAGYRAVGDCSTLSKELSARLSLRAT